MEGHMDDFVVKLLYVSFLIETITAAACKQHTQHRHITLFHSNCGCVRDDS